MAKHLIHAHSSTVTNGSPSVPSTSRIEYGELAVNYADGHETIMLKNSNDEIVPFVSKEYVDEAAAKEVQIGGDTPTGTNTIDIYVDTEVDPLTVDVYSKSQIDTKVTALEAADTATNSKVDGMIVIGTTGTTSDTELFVDTSIDPNIEVYSKAQVDTIIAKLKEDNHLI